MKRKKNFENKFYTTEQNFSRVRASYEAQIESNQHHSFLHFLFYYNCNGQHKYKISQTKWSFVFIWVDFQAIHTRFENQTPQRPVCCTNICMMLVSVQADQQKYNCRSSYRKMSNVFQ